MENESQSHSFSLLSHPDKLLIDHLRNVGIVASKTVADKSLNIAEADLLRDMAYIIGVTHDFGKATKFFQKYILEKDEKRKKSLKAMETTHHGLLSAFFTYSVVKDYLIQAKIEGSLAEYLPVISFMIVKKHHGNLSNATDETSDVNPANEEVLRTAEEQIDALDRTELEKILSTLLSERNIKLEIDVNTTINYILHDIMKDIGRKERFMLLQLSDKKDIYPYFINQFLYSSLINADKTDAGLDGISLSRLDLAGNLVDNYRDAKHFTGNKERINSLRNQIYKEAISRIEGWDLDQKIISLNVPTGTGKTLTALSISLKLRERLKNKRNFSPRIIYALPFLSIILYFPTF